MMKYVYLLGLIGISFAMCSMEDPEGGLGRFISVKNDSNWDIDIIYTRNNTEIQRVVPKNSLFTIFHADKITSLFVNAHGEGYQLVSYKTPDLAGKIKEELSEDLSAPVRLKVTAGIMPSFTTEVLSVQKIEDLPPQQEIVPLLGNIFPRVRNLYRAGNEIEARHVLGVTKGVDSEGVKLVYDELKDFFTPKFKTERGLKGFSKKEERIVFADVLTLLNLSNEILKTEHKLAMQKVELQERIKKHAADFE